MRERRAAPVRHLRILNKEEFSMYQTIRYEKQDNIGILTINRPCLLYTSDLRIRGSIHSTGGII